MTPIEEVEQHREARLRRLRSKDGWLSLVGRTILEEGDNTLDVAGATAHLSAGRVVLRVADGREHVWEASDKGPGPFLFVGEQRFELLRQGSKVAVRVRDPASPGLAAFRGLDFFPIDAKYRVEAKLVRAPKILTMAVGLGVDVDHECPGTLHFTIDGVPLSLDPVLEDGQLFVIFKDKTNGKTSYGAGRFLYAKMPGDDDVVTLDFNKSFNPPCALTDLASCPIAPVQNRLPIALHTGERYPLTAA